MNLRDYVYLNRTILVASIILFSTLLLLSNSGIVGCAHLEYTGNPCGSCGITRDFISFVALDFSDPINKNSLSLFIYLVMQFVFRLYMSSIMINQGGKKTLNANIAEHYGPFWPFTRVKIRSIKKVITTDVIITLVLGLIVIFPFWR